jgi:hypothetical protein
MLLPAYLGVIQYSFGTKLLVGSIAIILGIQVLVALPFIVPAFGGKTSVRIYLYYAKYLGSGTKEDAGKPLTLWGFSVLWQFLDPKVFYSPEFVYTCKLSILVLNVINFAVTHSALPVCIENLKNTFKSGKLPLLTHRHTKMMVECTMVGFVIGLVLMPGGHQQMQYYSRYFLPILILATGIPAPIVCWAFQALFPVVSAPAFYQDPITKWFRMYVNGQHLF